MPEFDKLGARRDPGDGQRYAKQCRIPSGLWGAMLLWGLAGAGLFSPQPVQAQATTTGLSRIENWQYSPEQGRLEVNTQGEVRPFLFILQDPPRVVLDFPNTRFGRDPQTQTFSGRVGSLQISQLTDTITRFVLHLQPGQPLSLNQLQLLTANPSRWAVQFTQAGNLSLSSPLPPSSGASAPPLCPPHPLAAKPPVCPSLRQPPVPATKSWRYPQNRKAFSSALKAAPPPRCGGFSTRIEWWWTFCKPPSAPPSPSGPTPSTG
ncbi:AMIN domain-containing protein [Thermostichus vulcanus]|uniref:AMIN domain-containing protein n=1 Tax=Thermostichus vulcanus TaxID=32053 RepID=UPI001FCCA58F